MTPSPLPSPPPQRLDILEMGDGVGIEPLQLVGDLPPASAARTLNSSTSPPPPPVAQATPTPSRRPPVSETYNDTPSTPSPPPPSPPPPSLPVFRRPLKPSSRPIIPESEDGSEPQRQQDFAGLPPVSTMDSETILPPPPSPSLPPPPLTVVQSPLKPTSRPAITRVEGGVEAQHPQQLAGFPPSMPQSPTSPSSPPLPPPPLPVVQRPPFSQSSSPPATAFRLSLIHI